MFWFSTSQWPITQLFQSLFCNNVYIKCFFSSNGMKILHKRLRELCFPLENMNVIFITQCAFYIQKVEQIEDVIFRGKFTLPIQYISRCKTFSTTILILDPGFTLGSIEIALVRQSVSPSVFKYLGDRSLVFSNFLHEVRAP